MKPDVKRRRLLQAMAATPLLGGLRLSSAAETEYLTRTIPASGERLPLIGVGTSRVFDVSPPDREGPRQVLELLSQVGNAMVDTSPMYGQAEEVVGDLSAELEARERFFLATKVWTSGREEGIAQMEESFRLLRTERIDLMQIHNLVDWRTHLPTLRDWKEQGRIRYIGITHYHEGAHDDLERVLNEEQLDFVQLNYSLVEPEAAERLLPLAAESKVAVIANRPFARGQLFRLTRGQPLPDWAAELDIGSWAQFFLKWVVSHPAVTCAIPGTGKLQHMQDNLQAARGRLPDAQERERMQALIRRL